MGVMVDLVVNWVADRIVEPTSWISVGVGAIVLSILVPVGTPYFLGIAGATALAGMLMKEKGGK
jgi:hypothetical protein|tara:strand:- start:241 stop:432 length:192 start_codon:yes stop_codon:yes gene_type:complete